MEARRVQGMSKLNTSRRRFRIINRMCTIVRPEIKTAREMSGTAHDYIDVPVIATHGEWPIVHGLSDRSLLSLAEFYASHGALPE